MKKSILIISCIGLCLSLKAQDQTISGDLDVTGNVGVGISNPTEKLQVNTGGSEFKTHLNGAEVTVNASGGWARAFRIRNESTSQNIAFGGHSGTAYISTGFNVATDASGYQNKRLAIKSNGYIGIGTDSPTTKLEIASDQTKFITLKRDGITKKGHIGYAGAHDGSIYLGTDDNTYSLYVQQDGKVGIGTISPDEQLAVNGKIHTKEVKVDLNGWSDFVFKPSYDLPTLEEVEKHISANGHLKDIPSEKEVIENGIHLGEMNSKLLQKIEELTLYTIEQEKQLDKQGEEIAQLKVQNKMIEEQAKDIKELKELVARLLEEK